MVSHKAPGGFSVRYTASCFSSCPLKYASLRRWSRKVGIFTAILHGEHYWVDKLTLESLVYFAQSSERPFLGSPPRLGGVLSPTSHRAGTGLMRNFVPIRPGTPRNLLPYERPLTRPFDSLWQPLSVLRPRFVGVVWELFGHRPLVPVYR